MVDLGLPDGDGVELVRRLRRAPGCPVLVLTMTRDEGVVRACLAAGAGGYLLKDSPPDAVVRAARTVLDGGLVLGPEIARAALPTGRAARLPAPLDRLSPADLRLLGLLADGRTNPRIAAELGVAEKTVAQPGVDPARRAGCRGPGAGRPAGPGEGPADRRSLFRMTGTRATLAATGAARVKGAPWGTTEDLVLMIKDDGLLHVGTRSAVLDHLLENPQGPLPTSTCSTGPGSSRRSLSGPTAPSWSEPDGDPPDAHGVQLLLDRIDLVLARWQVLLDTDPPEPTDGSAPPKRVLRVTGELPQVVDALLTLFPSPSVGQRTDPGDSRTGWRTSWASRIGPPAGGLVGRVSRSADQRPGRTVPISRRSVRRRPAG